MFHTSANFSVHKLALVAMLSVFCGSALALVPEEQQARLDG